MNSGTIFEKLGMSKFTTKDMGAFALGVIIVALLVFLVYKEVHEAKAEYAIGSVASLGSQQEVNAGGSVMRFVSSLAQPGQGNYTTATPLLDNVVSGSGHGMGFSKEGLIGNRGFPDFWEVSDRLNDYYSGDDAGSRGSAGSRPIDSEKEYMSNNLDHKLGASLLGI